jgi:hypothetical protein
MGGIVKSVTNAVKGVVNTVKDVATTVLKSPVLSFAASFIPVVGPFVAMASKIYNAYNAVKSGNLLGAASSFLGGSGIGSALSSTMSDVMGKVSSWIGPAGMNFATSALKAVGGNSGDVLKLAQMAGQVMQQQQGSSASGAQDLLTMIQHNATRLSQYSQALQFA